MCDSPNCSLALVHVEPEQVTTAVTGPPPKTMIAKSSSSAVPVHRFVLPSFRQTGTVRGQVPLSHSFVSRSRMSHWSGHSFKVGQSETSDSCKRFMWSRVGNEPQIVTLTTFRCVVDIDKSPNAESESKTRFSSSRTFLSVACFFTKCWMSGLIEVGKARANPIGIARRHRTLNCIKPPPFLYDGRTPQQPKQGPRPPTRTRFQPRFQAGSCRAKMQ